MIDFEVKHPMFGYTHWRTTKPPQKQIIVYTFLLVMQFSTAITLAQTRAGSNVQIAVDCPDIVMNCLEYAEQSPTIPVHLAELEDLTYADELLSPECGNYGFTNNFSSANWIAHLMNNDGGFHFLESDQLELHGANASEVNNDFPYVTKIHVVIAETGTIFFDWNTLGGDLPGFEALFVSINNNCWQLSSMAVTSGHWETPILQPGDILSFEVSSNGNEDNLSASISNLLFQPAYYAIVKRVWKGDSNNEGQIYCSQNIVIERIALDEVSFPTNLTLAENTALNCIQSTEPVFTGQPFYENINIQEGLVNNSCLSTQYVDNVETYCGSTYTIERVWTVVNTCTGNSTTHIQKIEVIDEDAPRFAFVPLDVTAYSSEESCDGAYVSMDPVTVTDCDPGFTITNNSAFAIVNTTDASGIYPLGTTAVTFTATDGCGNFSTAIVKVTVLDLVSPTAICVESITLELDDENGDATLYAENLNDGSFDNCNNDEFLNLLMQSVGSSTNTASDQVDLLHFGCSDIGTQIIELVVEDNHGNSAVCETVITVLDPSNFCVSTASIGHSELLDIKRNSDFQLFQNTPNPVYTSTKIVFYLPTDNSATLSITDVSGKILTVIDKEFYKGYNELNINRGELNSSGILFYSLESDGQIVTKQMFLP